MYRNKTILLGSPFYKGIAASNKNPIRNIVVMMFVILPAILLLSGCGIPDKSEKEILADLQASEYFISNNVKIDSYDIVKRQTDKDNHSDTVYITACVDEPELVCELSYIMHYVLYNDGWILENVERDYDAPWSISGLPENQLLEDIQSNDWFFDEFTDLEIIAYEIIDEDYECDISNYGKRFGVSINAATSLFEYTSYNLIEYLITEDGWNLYSVWIDSSHYAPKYSPDISASDEIMDSLELGSSTYVISYDSYEYLKAETDWENCMETRYYVATKNWWFGTEKYLVSIPLKFSWEDEKNSFKWTYSRDTIESSLQSVDWNIVGNWEGIWIDWEGKVDPYYGSVNLSIYRVC